MYIYIYKKKTKASCCNPKPSRFIDFVFFSGGWDLLEICRTLGMSISFAVKVRRRFDVLWDIAIRKRNAQPHRRRS
jgi:hypothetical protein